MFAKSMYKWTRCGSTCNARTQKMKAGDQKFKATITQGAQGSSRTRDPVLKNLSMKMNI